MDRRLVGALVLALLFGAGSSQGGEIAPELQEVMSGAGPEDLIPVGLRAAAEPERWEET